ncbi:MAG: hypothetical protein KJZ54_03745 [Phycisphaerales bacterium]|nr:hypothetical protein [Phycisphaerales bacterium]
MRMTPVLCVASMIAVCGHAAAADINVPGDVPTIQGAIEIAADGDRVLVSPGVYHERINLLGKSITVESTDGASVTAIDGGGDLGWVVFINGGATDAVLRRFTVTGGFGDKDGNGGGVRIHGSNATIEACILADNAGVLGGALSIKSGGATVIDSEFLDNRALLGAGIHAEYSDLVVQNGRFDGNETKSHGGAVAVLAGSARLTGSVFTDNAALNAGFGGAIFVNHADIDLSGLTFDGNGRAEQSGHNSWIISTGGGGAIYTTNANGRIEASRFTNNVAAFGTALYIAAGGTVEIVNNIIAKNAKFCECGTGALYTNTSKPLVVNNTFADNGGFFGIYNYNSTFSVANTVFSGQAVPIGGNYGLTTLNFSLYDNDLYRVELGAGNIRGHARLDPANGYAPRPGSPVIDAGDNHAVPAGVATDLLGNSRFFDDPDTADTGEGDAPIVDMGAIEFGSEPPALCPADMNGDGHHNSLDFIVYLSLWSAGDPLADFDADGQIDTRDFILFLNMWSNGC